MELSITIVALAIFSIFDIWMTYAMWCGPTAQSTFIDIERDRPLFMYWGAPPNQDGFYTFEVWLGRFWSVIVTLVLVFLWFIAVGG